MSRNELNSTARDLMSVRQAAMSVKIFPLVVFKIKFLLVIHRGPWYTKGTRAPVVLVRGRRAICCRRFPPRPALHFRSGSLGSLTGK